MTATLAQHPFATWFGIDEGVIRRVLAEATHRGADFADLYFQHSRHSSIRREDGIVSRATTGIDQGVGVRVVVGDQTGYAYSESLELEPMLHAARTAAAIASGSERVPPQGIELRRDADHYPTARPWEDVRVDEKLPFLPRVEELVRSLEPSIVKASVSWADADERVLIATSDGFVHVDRRPMASLRVAITCERDGQRCSGHADLSRRAGLEWFTEARVRDMCERAVARTVIQFEAQRPPAGELPVVLAAGASGILLHEAIGHGLEADFNRKGVSIYSDKLNQRVAPEFVTVIDDGTLPGERGAVNVDDEGTAAARTTLIEDGVLRTYLHDRISAEAMGAAATGSGRRESFRHMPMPRMRCTFMEDGPHGYDEMIAAVDHGIVAETFTNGQVQIGAGDFTFYVKTGWLIEKGKVTAPIKDVNIIGNGPRALADIEMVANDGVLDVGGWTCGKEGQRVPVSQGIPSVLVGRLTVGGGNG